jgi:hypothetical protein
LERLILPCTVFVLATVSLYFFCQFFFFSFWVPVPQPLVIGIWKTERAPMVAVSTHEFRIVGANLTVL